MTVIDERWCLNWPVVLIHIYLCVGPRQLKLNRAGFSIPEANFMQQVKYAVICIYNYQIMSILTKYFAEKHPT